MSGLTVAAGCALQVLGTTVTPSDPGWIEEIRIEVLADGAPCPWLDLPLPPGVHLAKASGRTVLGDGTRRRWSSARFDVQPRTLTDHGKVRIHAPELLSGDRAVIQLTRAWSRDDALTWTPAPARFAELRVEGGAPVERIGDLKVDGDVIWISSPGPADRARVGSGTWDNPFAALEPAGDVRTHVQVTLLVPPGDPQRWLYPGGGSAARVTTTLIFAAEERHRAQLVPLPADRSALTWSAQPPGAIEVTERPDGLVVMAQPSEGASRVALSWMTPDAPTFGERPSDTDSFDVDAPGGTVVWEGAAWRLAAIHDRPVLPSREALIRALDRRFRDAAIPEPGTPAPLRGAPVGWDTAARLRDALRTRAVPVPWTSDPLFPRKLVDARRSGAVTPLEASLIVWLYAKQTGVDADWALVRPATAGPGAPSSPAGYDAALVRMVHQGQTRWMDPTCTVCAPFELPPDLEGASALGDDLEHTPPPTPGRWLAEVAPDSVRWTLEGPAALDLRRWLLDIPGTERDRALAERMAGPGATLIRTTGIDTFGATISAEATRSKGAWTLPFDLPAPRDDGTLWVPWIGERVVRWTDTTGTPAAGASGPLSWEVTVEGNALVETLRVAERSVGVEHATAWGRSRPQRTPSAGDQDERREEERRVPEHASGQQDL